MYAPPSFCNCSVGLNKGGVALSLRLDDTHLAFVSSHLAAHQSKAAQRNSDMSEICANIRLQQPGSQPVAAGADLATSYHHLVWMGDLNYRLEYGQQVWCGVGAVQQQKQHQVVLCKWPAALLLRAPPPVGLLCPGWAVASLLTGVFCFQNSLICYH